MTTKIYAYGGEHEETTYEDARLTVEWFQDTDTEGGQVGLCRVSEDGYELVGMGVDSEGGNIGVDSDYVTNEVGTRLLKEGLVYPMVSGANMADFQDKELIARLTREQFGDY